MRICEKFKSTPLFYGISFCNARVSGRKLLSFRKKYNKSFEAFALGEIFFVKGKQSFFGSYKRGENREKQTEAYVSHKVMRKCLAHMLY